MRGAHFFTDTLLMIGSIRSKRRDAKPPADHPASRDSTIAFKPSKKESRNS